MRPNKFNQHGRSAAVAVARWRGRRRRRRRASTTSTRVCQQCVSACTCGCVCWWGMCGERCTVRDVCARFLRPTLLWRCCCGCRCRGLGLVRAGLAWHGIAIPLDVCAANELHMHTHTHTQYSRQAQRAVNVAPPPRCATRPPSARCCSSTC